jgi:hypothetical protein
MLPGFIATLDCWRELPAAVSAATTAAITAVTVPASPTAATATTTAGSSSSATARSSPATTATARSSSATTAATLTRRTSFVDDNVAAHEIVAVQSLDGALGFLVAIDFDKSEPAWLPRKTVAHQGDVRCGDSRLSK